MLKNAIFTIQLSDVFLMFVMMEIFNIFSLISYHRKWVFFHFFLPSRSVCLTIWINTSSVWNFFFI